MPKKKLIDGYVGCENCKTLNNIRGKSTYEFDGKQYYKKTCVNCGWEAIPFKETKGT
jgi:RNase P subunit RPR2